MVTEMNQRLAAAVGRAYDLMQRTEEMLNEPRPEPRRGWTPRHVEPPQPEPVRPRTTDAMIAREVTQLRADYKRDRAAIRECLDALADEAGATCGRLAKRIAEQQATLDAQQTAINDLRGQVSLLRALQPKNLLRRKSATQIEDSLSAHAAAVN